MFRPSLLTLVTAWILLQCFPALAETKSFKVCVTIPQHVETTATEETTLQMAALPNTGREQLIQEELRVRNNKTIMLKSIVVL